MKTQHFWIFAISFILATLLFFSGYVIYIKQEPRYTFHLAECGDVKAMVRLGVSYSMAKGGGIAPCEDRKEATKWLRKAAEKNDLEAIYFLAISLAETHEESQMWLKRGAELGSISCMVELSNRYLWGTHQFPKDLPAGYYWMLQSTVYDIEHSNIQPNEKNKFHTEAEKRIRFMHQYFGEIKPFSETTP